VIPSAPLGTDAAADRSGLGAATGAAPQGAAAQRRFRFELAAHPGSVAQARRLAHARLTGWAVCADTCESAALVISELVTNAIVHTASSRVVCELHDHDDMVRIAVRDEGCAPGEAHPSPQRPDEEHGRGLLLVGALCRAWGVQEHGPGLLVWAELARRGETAEDTAEPRDDLGWGARPKPGRPDDSDDDPAEAHRRPSDQHRHRAPAQPAHRAPEQRGHGSHGSLDHHRHRPPDQSTHPAPEPHRRRTAEQPLLGAPAQPLRRTPEQHHTGEQP
jgi:anti-sigma regulatory factor (Ser/Thr protein kinase)